MHISELVGAPVLALPNRVVFPIAGHRWTVSLARPDQREALERAAAGGGLVLVLAQLCPDEEWPGAADLFRVGVMARVEGLRRRDDGTLEATLIGETRAEAREIDDEGPLEAEAVLIPASAVGEPVARRLRAGVDELLEGARGVPTEVKALLRSARADDLADAVAASLSLPVEERQGVLEAFDADERAELAVAHVQRALGAQTLDGDVEAAARARLEGRQREVWLRARLHAIREALGDDDPEVDRLASRLAEGALPEATREAAERALRQLERQDARGPERGRTVEYLERLLDFPWEQPRRAAPDPRAVGALLDREHHGLASVKRRVIEDLAVRRLKPSARGPVLCLVGPPGVGKTSLCRSVAEALGRPFARISLGGVRDEADIRGHRRTYIGAMPGRVVEAIERAGAPDPVILLDEMDKLGRDGRGDPAHALLEVLDPSQNHAFRDHYLEVPVDLRGVLFIATANSLEGLPAPLLDRMECVALSSYLDTEKLAILRDHLVPRQLEAHGLDTERVRFTPEALRRLAVEHSPEAGVRGLSRRIAQLARDAAVAIVSGSERVVFDAADVDGRLGAPPAPLVDPTALPAGVAVALAWTPSGGRPLCVEAVATPGHGGLQLTGRLGEVLRESAAAAVSWLKVRAEALGLRSFDDVDIHVHLPGGGVPKDGPSAGLALVSALASLLLDRPIRPRLAFTGEITLRGAVLPVGGVREKLLGAARAGIDTVVLPRANRRDVERLPRDLHERVEIVWVDAVHEALEVALDLERESAVTAVRAAAS